MTDVITPVIHSYFSFKLEHLIPAFFTVMIPIMIVHYLFKKNLKDAVITSGFAAGTLTTIFFLVMYFEPSLYSMSKASQIGYAIIVAFLSMVALFIVNYFEKQKIPDKTYIWVGVSVLIVELLVANLLSLPVMSVMG